MTVIQKTSIIATTYNQPEELRLYLHSLCKQKEAPPFEVIIADDGSDERTKKVIESFTQSSSTPFSIKHIWHPDQGYRKSSIVNQAIRASSADWLIFTDADVYVHPLFVSDHYSMKAPWRLFMGRRVDLNAIFTSWFKQNYTVAFSPLFYIRLFLSSWHKNKSENTQRSIRIACPALVRLLKYDRVPDLLGSNFSIDRALLLQINGFNEDLKHYWGEDGDLFVRARNSKANIVGRKSFAIQLHLWHTRRAPQPGAWEHYQEILKRTDYVHCVHGLEN